MMTHRIELREYIEGVLKNINYRDPIVVYRGGRVRHLTKLISGVESKFPTSLGIDVFYSFYLPFPMLKEEGSVKQDKKQQYAIVKGLINSSFINDVKGKTMLDSFMSSLAASLFLSEYSMLEKKIMEKGVEGVETEVESIVNNVAKELDSVKKLRRIVESDEAGNVSMVAYEDYGPELIKLAKNAEVRKILELVSSFKPWDLKVSERRYRFKHGEIHGYELGDELERIVASNLALPDELFYLKLLEKKLLLYQKMVSETKGALYVLVDKSGSMDGVKMTWSKAVSISLYMKAVRERRPFYFRFFDSVPYELKYVGRNPRVNVVLNFIDYIAKMKGSGGTDISRALVTACSDIRMGKLREVNDIVLITDGVDRINENAVRTHLKKANARLITVMVLGDNRSLKNVSYRYFAVTLLTQRNILKVIEID